MLRPGPERQEIANRWTPDDRCERADPRDAIASITRPIRMTTWPAAGRDPYTPHYPRSVGAAASARARTEGDWVKVEFHDDPRMGARVDTCFFTAKQNHATTTIVACSSQTSTVAELVLVALRPYPCGVVSSPFVRFATDASPRISSFASPQRAVSSYS